MVARQATADIPVGFEQVAAKLVILRQAGLGCQLVL